MFRESTIIERSKFDEETSTPFSVEKRNHVPFIPMVETSIITAWRNEYTQLAWG